MNFLLIYLLKVFTIQAVLYLIYALAFHKSGRHAINRYYINIALVTSFLIPFISIAIPDTKTTTEIVNSEKPVWYEIAEMTSNQSDLIPVETANQSSYTIEFIFMGILFLSLFLLIKLVFSHFQLVRLRMQSERIIKNGTNVYCSKIENPFSYFSSIFIPKSILESSSFNTILKHELVHVNKRHSIDRVFHEIILAFFWFNPFHYLFRNRLIETHEFQADEGVISTQNDPIGYQEVLYQQIHSQFAFASANHFKLNTIKTRIKMMNQNKKLSKWHYLFVLPVLAIMTFAFANKERNVSVAPLKSNVSEVFENIINSPSNFIPSIFPLKDAEGVKLTSAFGKRLHPILKVESMHEGIDLKTYEGNPVLATADGIVVEVNSTFGGFGKRITIDHNGLYQTTYAHLSEFKVEKGDKVRRGDLIGAAGTTGESSGPHLHYEVKEIGKDFLDPVDFIQNYDFKTISEKVESVGEKSVKSNQKLRVVLDPGHGGRDKGIVSKKLAEKEIALKVATEIAEIFKNSDQVEIILTREEDEIVSLKDRVRKSENADIFISLHTEIHANENEDMMLAIYNDQNDNAESSKNFGELMKHEYTAINKEFKVAYTDGYYILQNAKAPAILFIMGYFSNSEAEDYLNSDIGIKQIALELSDAIEASL
ncbi:N-acetylmuramoyl-L-alanine amidase [Marivirga salinae]|uniref:N-acetylmuramoyl-L-alanine amidase n=1 Tax=Marivirga salinarum TaxID=3059078 RepID=A0AA51N9V1_9BACT|nr:N-acetylmuramoyl-L-alanine amidase [Marivirga sp. BDSF4-3]WMN11124.1 N-acetylmuramoyl-L-alanine amidase [Marivirga sp. BDSF4-3]